MHRSDGTKLRQEVDPSTFFQVLGGFAIPYNDPLAATGSTIGDAAAIQATGITKATGADGTVGVKLPATGGVGGVFIILNRAGAILKLYPDSATGKINDGTSGAALSVAANTSVMIFCSTGAGITNSLFYTLPLVPS